jgi:hypothetical protein
MNTLRESREGATIHLIGPFVPLLLKASTYTVCSKITIFTFIIAHYDYLPTDLFIFVCQIISALEVFVRVNTIFLSCTELNIIRKIPLLIHS